MEEAMPQEVIYPPYPGVPWRTRVGWTRDGGDVQIAVETADESLIGTLLSAEDRARFGKAAREDLSGLEDIGDKEFGDALVETLSEVAPYVSVWARLDRAGANRLIRLIRGARDAAFGKDE